jgi:hypothetical protein
LSFVPSKHAACFTVTAIGVNASSGGRECNSLRPSGVAEQESRTDESSATEPSNESFFATPSNYRHSESRAETEHRYKDAKKSGVTDEVQ